MSQIQFKDVHANPVVLALMVVGLVVFSPVILTVGAIVALSVGVAGVASALWFFLTFLAGSILPVKD